MQLQYSRVRAVLSVFRLAGQKELVLVSLNRKIQLKARAYIFPATTLRIPRSDRAEREN